MEENLLSISPIDGRYKENTEEVRKYFNEYHLIKNRIIVEIQWLKKLFAIKEIGLEIEGKELNILDKIAKEFDIKVAKEFVEGFGLEYNMYTTQIESHDNIAIMLSEIKILNNIILDFDNDIWMYISRNYFKQQNVAGEVGSSVMPHKINPINFENSMANIKISNGIIDVFFNNLQISKMQRDLSDSSLQRNIGMVLAYSLIAIKQTIIGINKLTVNEERLRDELNNTPEVLAEAIQTILRKNGYEKAYETLKGLTRGKNISREDIREFVINLEIDEQDKEMLLNSTPEHYIGLAEKIARKI